MEGAFEITRRAFDILAELMEGDRTIGMTGLQLCEALSIPTGTIHPTMARLERSGFAESRCEGEPFPGAKSAPDSQPIGRPSRRFYRITGGGRTAAAAWRQQRSRAGGPDWSVLPKLA